jgi:hypothetical protein
MYREISASVAPEPAGSIAGSSGKRLGIQPAITAAGAGWTISKPPSSESRTTPFRIQ